MSFTLRYSSSHTSYFPESDLPGEFNTWNMIFAAKWAALCGNFGAETALRRFQGVPILDALGAGAPCSGMARVHTSPFVKLMEGFVEW